MPAEIVGERVEQRTVARRIGRAQVVHRLDQAAAHQVGPDPVDDHAGKKRVVVADDPVGQHLSRIAVGVRDKLLFGLTGGSAAAPPVYRLNIQIGGSSESLIVDINSGRPDTQEYGLSVNYNLVEMKTGKTVFTSDTFARVSYDIPGQEQRFARARGLRDSENRAAKLIADNIKSRLASYFVAGT